jgi:hypothetical protein
MESVYKKGREEKTGEERIPISLFHVRSVLLVDLASVSDIRFSADSEVGKDRALDRSYKRASDQTRRGMG